MSLEDRFWAKVALGHPDGCWLWQASLDHNGYGQVSTGPRGTRGVTVLKAHRVMYGLTYGPLAPWMDVLHTCDQPSCVNPAHLWVGDHKANMDDRDEKHRVHSKLTAEQVREIRHAYLAGERQTDLARRYGVTKGPIWTIVHHHGWRRSSAQID